MQNGLGLGSPNMRGNWMSLIMGGPPPQSVTTKRAGCRPPPFSPSSRRLKGFQHGFRTRHLEGAGVLDVERLHHAVLRDERIAPRALAHAVAGAVHLESDRTREIAIAVGEHQHLVVDFLILAPGVHDEGVVDREARDGVDTLTLEIAGLLHEARQVLRRAGRRESAWGKDQKVDDKVLMLADGNGDFTRAVGLEMDGTGYGMGKRSRRYALVAQDGVVKTLNVENPGAFEVSRAEAVLKAL